MNPKTGTCICCGCEPCCREPLTKDEAEILGGSGGQEKIADSSWISVEEQLPEKRVSVLAHNTDGYQHIDEVREDGRWHSEA